MTNLNYTHIVLVLDRSGSMSSVRSDTIGGINTFFAEQRKLTDKCTFTLHQFDDKHEYVYQLTPMSAVADLTPSTFVPRGATALLDAIGLEINATGQQLGAMPEPERPAKVLFVIMTDGEENASKEFTNAKIAEMITAQRDIYKWQFVFMGANQNAYATARAYHIPTASTMTYGHNAAGVASASASLDKMVKGYRGASGQSVASGSYNASFDDQDKEWQKQAGVDNTKQP